MIQAPQSMSPPREGMSIYARARVCIICAIACATLGWAHQSNIEYVELDPAHRIEDEQARIMLREALIKESMRGRIAVDPAPPESTVRTMRGVSKKAYTIRPEKVAPRRPVTLGDSFDEFEDIKKARRDRMEARGESVRDMEAKGQTTFRSALENLSSAWYNESQHRHGVRKRRKKLRRNCHP